MQKILVAMVMTGAVFGFAGCKKKGGGGAGEAMAKMTEMKDKMCACKDKACADGVQADMTKWAEEQAKNAPKEKPATDEKAMKEMQEVGTKYAECMTKAMTPEAGSAAAAPPPEGSAGSGEAPAATADESTGAPECDELIKRTMCSYDKAGASMPAEAKDAFKQSVGAWKEALKNEATKQATIDACKMSLDAAKEGFAKQGC